ncbi:hypothetical protein BOTBODRAFT_97607, partial [Botryobasidium botryosum FD-172 SS1]
LGVPLMVDDLYSFDSEVLAAVARRSTHSYSPKWDRRTGESDGGAGVYDEHISSFFANKVVNNTCATIAVLKGVCNIPSVAMGTEFLGIVFFSAGMESQTQGEIITPPFFLLAFHNFLSPP